MPFHLKWQIFIHGYSVCTAEWIPVTTDNTQDELDLHEYVHRDIIMNTTNEMQLYRLIYYS